MKKLLVLTLLLFPFPVLAETYQWTDQRGTVNFTEDLGKVPKKYRKKVKVLGGEESSAPATEAGEPVKGGVVRTQSLKEQKVFFGGKDEKGWRSEFAQVKGDLKLAEQDLADFRSRLSDTSRMSRTDFRTIQNSVKHEEFRVQELKKRLEALTLAADKAGVPADFR